MIYSFLRRSCLWHLRRAEHIFDEDAVPRGGIVDEDVSDGSHELAVLNDRASAHECGQ